MSLDVLKKFNVNEHVWVKLNANGVELYRRSFDCIPAEIRESVGIPELKVDAEGYSKLQMWEFMQIFGSHVFNGCNPPFDPTVKFNSQDLKEVSETQ
jgi:hypothetical protein